jgi:tryptophanyl-tRNA synthetase
VPKVQRFQPEEKNSTDRLKLTGTPHIGNYLGMIRPALELAEDYEALYFIADYHALTTVKNSIDLNRLVCEVAAAWLALGLNPGKVTFFRQSDIPEVFEMAWILSCFTPKGLLNRAHAYKAANEANLKTGIKRPLKWLNNGTNCIFCAAARYEGF